MLSLKEHTEKHREKLVRRLTKQGVCSVLDMPYENYLRSTLWSEIRDWVVESQSGRCAVCDQNAEEVHHHDYDEETMWGERSIGLVGLCARCHKLIEFDRNNTKRVSLVDKKRIYEELVATFKTFENVGFEISFKRVRQTISVEYVGSPTFLCFQSLSALAFEFIVCACPYEEISFPLPFGRDKLQQKSGAPMRSRTSSQKVATVWATPASITVKLAKICAYPIEDYLHGFLVKQPHIRIVT